MSEVAKSPFAIQDEYIQHPLLSPNSVEAREYQIELATSSLDESTIVALPTGTGKSIVSLLTAAERLHQFQEKILFLAPLKPLVQQQAELFEQLLDIPADKIQVFTGEVRPHEREEKWNTDVQAVFATPQVIENDIVAGRISLSDVVHLTVDECHRATGEYPYTFIAKEYWKSAANPLVTGLSASPGTDKETIMTLCENLGTTNIEVLSENDDSLQEYLYETTVTGEFIDLPEATQDASETIEEKFKSCTGKLKQNGYLSTINPRYGQLQNARKQIQKDINNGDTSAYSAMSVYAEAVELYELQKIIERKGLRKAQEKIKSLKKDVEDDNASKAVTRIINDPDIQSIEQQSVSKPTPKLSKLRVLTAEKLMDGEKVIVFAEYVDTVDRIVSFLQESGMRAEKFIGQSGMSQQKQQQRLKEFRNNDFDVLVATKVAEEGLDLPQVSRIIIYHPVASGLRKVQRAGRTGRASKGEVKILVNKNTREEGLFYAAKKNKQKMESNLEELATMREDIVASLRDHQRELQDSSAVIEASDTTQVIVDSREMQSTIGRELHQRESLAVSVETLAVGDYVLSNSCSAERKTVTDFLDTLTGGDRSLFEQLSDLADAYEKPVLLLEGDISNLYSGRVHQNAVDGALASLRFDFGVQVIQTASESETADWIERIATREQDDSESTVQAHGNKTTTTTTDHQEYIVSSIENIGSKTAQSLLAEFNTIENIMTASTDELQEVDGVGTKTAEQIRSIVTEEYS